MKKWIALLLAAVMCLSLCACGGNSASGETQAPAENNQGSTNTPTAGQTEGTPETTAPTTQPGIPLSDDLSDFTVSIDGVVYQLLCSPLVFFNNGWLPEMDWVLEDDYLYPGDSTGIMVLYKEGENKEIGLRVCNTSKNDKPLSKCIVIGIYNEMDTDVEFTLGGGFALTNNTTDETVFSVMGKDYTDNNGDWYDYLIDGTGTGHYEFSFKDGHLIHFKMEVSGRMYEN